MSTEFVPIYFPWKINFSAGMSKYVIPDKV